MSEKLRKKIGTICLIVGTFLNPFGYDLLVYKLTQLTKNYWTTMHILYASAALFFILFFIFYRINPFKHVHNYVKKITIQIKKINYVKKI
jgi:hypothetical protein